MLQSAPYYDQTLFRPSKKLIMPEGISFGVFLDKALLHEYSKAQSFQRLSVFGHFS
jgi:hypothetical protein